MSHRVPTDLRLHLSFRVIRRVAWFDLKGFLVTVTAYILIQAEVGCAADVARATAALPEIVLAEVAMGPYDVIARAEAENMDQLGSVVVNAVGSIQCVERTLLCPIVNL